jgi:hypothetical protein
MRQGRIFAINTLLLATVSPAYAQTASGQTQITVTYDGNEDLSGPSPQRTIAFHHQFDIVLSNRNQIKERHVWGGGINIEDQKLGGEKVGTNVVPNRYVWRVLPAPAQRRRR